MTSTRLQDIKAIKDWGSTSRTALAAIADLLAVLPTWIPVSERLPDKPSWEDKRVYLVRTTAQDYALGAYRTDHGGFWDSWSGDWDSDEDPATHWMPLPEPPA